ncbi:MAG: DUF1272 domain-containing protein [Bacteroidota bacterium]
MLEIRPSCEHCGKALPNTSTEAMICIFECTYCTYCAKELFENVCPSCGGNFQPRPIRPSKAIEKHPASKKSIVSRKTLEQVEVMKSKFAHLKPEER